MILSLREGEEVPPGQKAYTGGVGDSVVVGRRVWPGAEQWSPMHTQKTSKN